jgi:DNA repair photolyase
MRGTELNLHNRFETRTLEPFDDGWERYELSDLPIVQTVFYPDKSKSIISYSDSPDLGDMASINPYRGCEHGCAYCYARPSHEYLGFNPALDFESKITVKHEAAELLRAEMMKKTWKPDVLSLSGNTDCYQPAERKFGITRKILEVLLEFRNPVAIITKNVVCLRDIDILSEMAKLDLVAVFFSISTLQRDLQRTLEPRTATPARKLEAMRKLTDAGVPCGVMNAPVIPGLTDHEMPAILDAARDAGAIQAGYQMVRLSYGIKDIFLDWLTKNRPLEANKVKSRLMMIRGGQLSDARFGYRMKGEGGYADYIAAQFKVWTKKYGLNQNELNLTTKHFSRPGTLFG